MTDEPQTDAADLAEAHGATEEDPGQAMAQDTAAQLDAALDTNQAETDQAAAGSFTVVDQTGESHEIVRKEARGQDIVLVSSEGAEFQPSAGADIGDTMGVIPYQMESETGTIYDDNDADYSMSAEEAAELGDEARGIDRTGDDELQEPSQVPPTSPDTEQSGEPSEVMGGADGPLPPTDANEGAVAEAPEATDLEAEQPSGGDAKDGPPEADSGDAIPENGPAEPEVGPPADKPEATEAAEKLAEAEGIDLSKVEGSGADGKVIKPDVEAVIEKQENDPLD